MQDLDFEQVKGFEPSVHSPYSLLDSLEEHRHDDRIIRLPSQLAYLDELTLSLQPVTEVEASDDNEPVSIPFVCGPRQSVRWQFSNQWCAAELRVLGRRYPCQIVEMSIGGFGILLPRMQSFQPGTLGQLRAPGLNFIVSVTRIEPRAEGSFLGLKQVEEVLGDSPFIPDQGPSIAGYLIAGVAGALIAVVSYYFMLGQ